MPPGFSVLSLCTKYTFCFESRIYFIIKYVKFIFAYSIGGLLFFSVGTGYLFVT